MKLFQDAVLAGLYVGGVEFVPRKEREKGIDRLASFLAKAQDQITLVSGELESEVYERFDVYSAIEKLLKKNGSFRALIGPVRGDLFMDMHPNIARLQQQHSSQLKIYSAEKYPEAHFGVVDNKHIFYEESHKPHEDREVYYEYGNGDLAKKLSNVFEEVVAKAQNR